MNGSNGGDFSDTEPEDDQPSGITSPQVNNYTFSNKSFPILLSHNKEHNYLYYAFHSINLRLKTIKAVSCKLYDFSNTYCRFNWCFCLWALFRCTNFIRSEKYQSWQIEKKIENIYMVSLFFYFQWSSVKWKWKKNRYIRKQNKNVQSFGLGYRNHKNPWIRL